ncbi:MAG: cation:proton antiporter [Rhodospirillaceae bacterium]|nr:cation:proton antiporter [Rhodospirillaceae bacterium]
MLHHLPVLQVAIPLIAAPLCVLLTFGGHRRLAWIFTLIVSWVAFIIAVLLLRQVLLGSEISYAIGNWPPPFGIEYRVDAINAFVLLIVSGISAIALPFARAVVDQEVEQDRHILFYTSYLLCLAGLLGVTITGDAFNIFVFLEISSLSSYVLIATGVRQDRRALTAAYNYLILGTIGATFFVIGIGLLYMVTGTLNIADLSERLRPLGDNRVVHAGYAFIVIGMALKLALFPMHVWLPNAYTYAPSLVSVFLAATSTKVSVYVLLRFLFTVFGPAYGFVGLTFELIFLPLVILAIFAGSIAAIYQKNVKKLFAYSSVAQLGYMILGLAFANTTGLMATVLHIFNHALMKGALFMALGCVMYRVGSVSLTSLRGLGRRMPWTFAAMVLAGLSLIGVPGTVGFVSKWYLIMGALENSWWPVAGMIVVSSLLAVIYIWKIIEVGYLETASDTPAVVNDPPLEMLIPLWVLVFLNVYFGIDTDLTTWVAKNVADTFLGVGK